MRENSTHKSYTTVTWEKVGRQLSYLFVFFFFSIIVLSAIGSIEIVKTATFRNTINRTMPGESFSVSVEQI